ncbi:MAG: UDP-N-acetylmuramate dehydrogenase [Candidatus Omnitrophota bacterium]
MNLSFAGQLNIECRKNASLSDYTTFRLGGPCPCLLTCQTPSQLERTVEQLRKENMGFILIGGGSNLIFSDEGLDCCVIRYVSAVPSIQQEGTELVVTASTRLDELSYFAAANQLAGLSFAAGIPGTVGGAIVGNAGAFGKQIGDCVVSVTVMTADGARKELSRGELGLSYRHSNLKETNDIILTARICLTPGDKSALLREREEVIQLRKQKHPDYRVLPSAGSIFRNLELSSQSEKRQAAGWFLEQAGAKELHCGGAAVYEKHANIIVRSGECRAQDVLELTRKMADAVKLKFGLSLVREVRFVGRFKGEEPHPGQPIW